MLRFSIVVVTYNSERYIKECLESICNQDFNDYEIILIDNASSDGTLEEAKSRADRIRIEINRNNEGFSAAVNKGIGLSGGEYLITLNPDVVLERNFLSELCLAIERIDDGIGMIGVKILRKNSDSKTIDSTGLVLSKAARVFDRGSGDEDRKQYDSDTHILGPCAAAAVYRRKMLEDIRLDGEYFDKNFFYLMEDFDIALRAQKKGWKCSYLASAVCYHMRNGSGASLAYRQHLAFRNRYFLIIKNMKLTPSLLFYFMLYDIPRILFMVFTNRYTLKAIREVKQYLPAMLAKRRSLS